VVTPKLAPQRGAPGVVPPGNIAGFSEGGNMPPTSLSRLGWPTATEQPRPLGRLLLRKEVIQPHLPVRLPCYDFVPIASPTFDGSLPYGLGHRLRVLPTFVT
jgi:hypothetical protein